MIDIHEIAELLTLNHGKNILLNAITNEWLVYSNIQLLRAEYNNDKKLLDYISNSDNYVPLFEYEDKIMLEDIKMFLNENEDIKNLITENLTITRFVNLIKKNESMFNKWIEYFKTSISFEVYHWVDDYLLDEKEAPQEYYKIIKELFLEFMAHEYYKQIPDNQLITLSFHDEGHVVIMGNANITYGISFYLSEEALDYFKLEHLNNASSITDFSLNKAFNIYLEINKEENPFVQKKIYNPYGEDNNVTSIYCNVGTQYNCYIPYSLALKIIRYLKMLNDKLPKLLKSEEFKELDIDERHEIDLCDDYIFVHSLEGNFSLPEYYFYNFEEHMPYPIKKAKYIDSSLNYEISLRRATSFVESDTDPRIINIVYILLIVNRDTGEIVYPLMSNENVDDPMLTIYYELEDYMKKNPMAKTIYANSLCDLTLLECFLNKFIKSGEIKLEIDDNKMLLDDVWEKFDEAINNIEDYECDA